MAELLTERYRITKQVNDQTASITVEISSDDEITIDTKSGHRQMVFTRCNKDLVMAMGQAIQEAAELVDSRKVTAA